MGAERCGPLTEQTGCATVFTVETNALLRTASTFTTRKAV